MSLLKNSTLVIAGVIVANALAYIFHIYVGRVLGPADYGIFGTLLALYSILALPSSAIGSAITKFTARYNAKNDLNKIGNLRKKAGNKSIVYSIIFFILILLASPLIASYFKINSIWGIVFVGFSVVFTTLLSINRGILQGMKRFKDYSLNTVYESIIRLILVVILLYFGLKSNGALLAYGLAYFFAFLLIFPKIKETKYKKDENLGLMKIYRFVFIVLIANLILQAIINFPTIFIRHYASAEFTGYWNAALTLARISLFVTSGIAIAMFPEIAERTDKKGKVWVFRKALLLTLIASATLAIAFLLFGNLAVGLLYGSAYLPSVSILGWLGMAMIPLSILQLWINYWVASIN